MIPDLATDLVRLAPFALRQRLLPFAGEGGADLAAWGGFSFQKPRFDRQFHRRRRIGEQRGDLPVSVFIDLLSSARERIQFLVYAAGIESRCRLALLRYKPLLDVPGAEVRTHGTTLYNSIFRADDQMLVNAHVWGVDAYGAPVWHLRRAESETMFNRYAESFDAVWSTAREVRQ
ncbi:hypothetical protein [Streptomyces sp. KE1]|uniref:hypothetical protein n=1 Tax=Streptomyces sp. KE1 TaxID=1638939 RepID=UPI00069F867A|nr:hypothetical protein [Streptomyces sp. KE1]